MDTALSFRDILDSSIVNLQMGSALTSIDILIGLFVSLFCAIIINWTYRITYQGVLYQKSFNIALIMASLITTSLIMVISSNLVLSLGMVGALSIVRFRSAIKDPLDIIFMFWALSVGIANGVANFKISIIQCFFFAVVMFVLSKMKIIDLPYLMVVKYEASIENSVIELLKRHTKKYRIKTKTVKADFIELTVEVRVSKTDHVLVNSLNDEEKVHGVALLAYSNDLNDLS